MTSCQVKVSNYLLEILLGLLSNSSNIFTVFLCNSLNPGELPPTYIDGFHYEDWVRCMEYRMLGKTGFYASKLSLGKFYPYSRRNLTNIY